MVNNSILSYCQISLIFITKCHFLLFLTKLTVLGLNIFIFNFNDIFLVLINDTQQLSLNLNKMISHFIFVQKIHLFF